MGVSGRMRTKEMRSPGALHTMGARRRRCAALLHWLHEEESVDTKFLDELNRRVSEMVAATPAKDIEKNLRALLSGALSRLDLVTREEFDVQQDVLRRTREKLQQMEARVAELEVKLKKE